MINFQTHLPERARTPRKKFNLTVTLRVNFPVFNVKKTEERTNKVILILERNVPTGPLDRTPGYLQPFEYELKNLTRFNTFESNVSTPNYLFNADLVHYGFVCTNPKKTELDPRPQVSVEVIKTGSTDPNKRPDDLAGIVLVPRCNKFTDVKTGRKH